MSTTTSTIAATPDAVARAAELIKRGALVAFPTETVYGLGADATNDRAVAAIFEAKKRPRFNPLIVHVSDPESAFEIGGFDDLSLRLCRAFWPGALTLVVRRREPCPISLLASAGLETVAVRQPSDRTARALIEKAGVPVAAPSANRSGRVSPTTARHVADELGAAAALILDGGPCESGLESTVLRVDENAVELLRTGSIPVEDIEKIAGPVDRATRSERPLSPGQLSSHYAPRHKLRLNAAYVEDDETLLAFGRPADGAPLGVRNLSPTSDLIEAGANFYAFLRELDEIEAAAIAVMPIPDRGLGEAMNDRLRRALAARD